jgi:hypothetical protein
MAHKFVTRTYSTKRAVAVMDCPTQFIAARACRLGNTGIRPVWWLLKGRPWAKARPWAAILRLSPARADRKERGRSDDGLPATPAHRITPLHAVTRREREEPDPLFAGPDGAVRGTGLNVPFLRVGTGPSRQISFQPVYPGRTRCQRPAAA